MLLINNSKTRMTFVKKLKKLLAIKEHYFPQESINYFPLTFNKEFWSAFHKTMIMNIWDAMRDLVPFVQSKNMKNTHEGVLLSVKLQAKAANTNNKHWDFCIHSFEVIET